MTVCYVNGEFQDFEKASVPFRERAFLYGDGVFTNLLLEEGNISFWDDHVKRLKRHAEVLGIESSHIEKEVIKKLVNANQAFVGLWQIRVIVTAGTSEEMSLAPRRGGVYIFLKKLESKPKNELKLCIFPEPISYPLAKIKPISYMNRLWIKDYALKHKSDDALVVSSKGYILEASTANVFWIHNEYLFYPSEELPHLLGITLQKVLEAAKTLHLKPKPGHYREEHLLDSCVYVSSSVTGVQPVSYLKDHKLQRDQKQESALKEAFEKIKKKHQFSCA